MVLDHYRKVLRGEVEPAFHICRGDGDLGGKILEADVMMSSCELCEWRCMADRANGRTGHCGVAEPVISSEFLHMGEERELVPSHTIFFAGCNLDCVFCQNNDISTRPANGVKVKPEDLASVIDRHFSPGRESVPLFIQQLSGGGGRNVNFVGGDPTPNLPFILEVLNWVTSGVPVVWNSNMFLTEEGMALLDGVVDLYLTDLKYGNDECGQRLSGVKDYFGVITRNHVLARRNGDMIIRHLVLPGHIECCTIPIIDWVQENLDEARINIMDQYRPEHNAREYAEISSRLSQEEYRRAVAYAEQVLDQKRFPMECPI